MIAIIDYQMGNLRSVQKAFERVGHAAAITADPRTLEQADHIVLPGVGAFADAIAEIRRRELIEPIRAAIDSGKGRYSRIHQTAHSKPTIPHAMNTQRHEPYARMAAMAGGAITAPTAVPAFTRPIAVDRSATGNRSAMTSPMRMSCRVSPLARPLSIQASRSCRRSLAVPFAGEVLSFSPPLRAAARGASMSGSAPTARRTT